MQATVSIGTLIPGHAFFVILAVPIYMRSYQQYFFFDYFHDIRCSLAICFSIGASDSFIKTLLKSKHRWIQKLKEESNTAIQMAT